MRSLFLSVGLVFSLQMASQITENGSFVELIF